jgi:hypothetical protein
MASDNVARHPARSTINGLPAVVSTERQPLRDTA